MAGINFGPAGTLIDSAIYGVPNGTLLISPGCTLVTPHTLMWCNTSVGAGAGLSWTVTIDGQASGEQVMRLCNRTLYALLVLHVF